MNHKNIIKPSLAPFAFFLLLFSFFSGVSQQQEYLELSGDEWVINKEKYFDFLDKHPFTNRPSMTKKELKSIAKYDRPDLAYEHDWIMTHDPQTGTIPWERLVPVLNTLHGSNNTVQTGAPGSLSTNNWVERGPNNIGGRTRAIMFDPTDNTNKKVFAGGVGGGLWYNNDITSSTSTWNSINDFWANLAVTCITYDPTADSVFYVGTGEGWSNSDAIRGAGIWKSTNSGNSFSQLSSTNISAFRTVQKIVITANGRIIAVTGSGIFTSDNDGATFTQRRAGFHGDLELASNGDLYATFGKINSSGKIYKSVNNGTSWTDITPSGGSPERIELACAPSDSNTIYAVASIHPNGKNGADVEWFKKSINGGGTWTNIAIPAYLIDPNKHFTRGQAWYDLILWVHPTDKDVVIAGGVDLHRSTNGGTSWTGISFWYSGQGKPEVHADQHNIISRPGNNNGILVGNDGGVYYSTNAGNKNMSSPTFSHMVNGYNVTQFYSAAIHPTSGSNYMLAGAQDNGTLRLNASGVGSGVEVTGGDGAFCFIDQDNPNYQITSYIENNWRRSTNGGNNFSVIQAVGDGSFINPADYDDNRNVLYSAKSTTQLNRISNMTSGSVTTGAITITGLSELASHIRVSPYTTSSSTIFVGSQNNGEVYKVVNADGNSPTSTEISGTTLPSFGSVSCIEIGASENELLVTFSNYGVTSVWYTSNGGTSWVNKEGNLPDMPVRWAMFNPKNRSEVILATELGVYATDDILATSVNWTSSNLGMALTRMDMFQYRSIDSLIMVSTHGRGVYTGRFKSAAPPSLTPVVKFGASKTTICVGESVTFTDSSTNNPTALLWTFTGGTPTSSTSSTPSITYNSAGTYAVKLRATNANGSDSLTKTALISVNAAPNAALATFTSLCSNSPTQTLSGGTPTGGTYFINGNAATSINPSSMSAGTYTIKYRVQVGSCSDSATQTLTINQAPSVSTSAIAPVCISNPTFTLSNGTPTGGVYSGTGVSSGMFNPATAGTGTKSISYKVIGSNGCADSSQFNIVVQGASLSTIGPFCVNDNPITLFNGSPSGGFYFGNGVIVSQFAPVVAGVGTHILKYVVSYSSGCRDTASTSVVVSPGSSASLSPFSAVCADTSFTLTGGSPAGGVYTGTGVSAGVFDASVAGTGTHTIVYTVTSGCGTSSDTRSITVDSIPTVSVTKSVQDCKGKQFQFNATGATSYSWSPTTGLSNPVIGNPSLIIPGSINYILTGSYRNGCSSTDTIVVTALNQPNVKANIDLSVCIGDTFQLSATGATSYKWVPSTGLDNDTLASPKGVLSTSATYIVTGSNGGQCSGNDTVNVDVKPKSAVSHNTISDVCLTSSPITLVGGTPSGGTYSGVGVSGGTFDPSVAGLGSHIITYSASEPGKCIAQTTVNIVVSQSPSIVWSVPNTICDNESPLALVSTPSGGTYSGKGVSGTKFDPAIAGAGFHTINYQVTSTGCLSNEKREIEVVPGSVTGPVSGLLHVTKGGKYNYSVKSINGASYTWIITGGGLLSSANNLSTIQWGTSNTGTITLIQTNGFGCTDTTELLININALSVGDEVKIGEGVILYPNPADKSVSLKIESNPSDEVNIRLFNNSGQQVLGENNVTQIDEVYEINISEFADGLYLIQAEIGTVAYSATLIIKH